MIDLHCHVLPGVDDGPSTLEEAIELTRTAQRDGIGTIAATPHITAGYPNNTSANIGAWIAELQPHVGVTIVPGGEVDILRAVELDDHELHALRLNHGPWLLLECPLSPVRAPALMPTARALAARGHRLLLAHPERSPVFHKRPGLLRELTDEGMLAQVTAGALTGQFGRPVRDLAHAFVNEGTVHVAASDGHNPNRPATMARELEQAGVDPDLAHWLTTAVPEAILHGAAIPQAPDRPQRIRRRLLGR